MGLMEIENLGGLVTAWSIRIAMICMFGSFFLRLLHQPAIRPTDAEVPAPDSMRLVGSRNLWLLGSFFSLIHGLAALIYFHQGSHELAFADTARQTEALLGVSVGAGIYLNYAFVLFWLSDAMWWIARPDSYQTRPRFFNWSIYGFLIFIAINGTIVFESGVVRWTSVAGLALLGIMAYRRTRRSE